MISKRILILLVFTLLSLPGFAQNSGSGISINTVPSGSEVMLVGDITLAGISPIKFNHDISGKYEIIINKEGYETYKSSIYLKPGTEYSNSFTLKPKTRFKAFARSLLIPGWGQKYSDQGKKGAIFFGLALGSTVSYFIADNKYSDELDNFYDLKSQYDASNNFEEKRSLYDQLSVARKDAYDAETLRRITLGAVIASWSINLIDLLFAFPDKSYHSEAPLTVTPDLKNGGGQIVFTYTF